MAYAMNEYCCVLSVRGLENNCCVPVCVDASSFCVYFEELLCEKCASANKLLCEKVYRVRLLWCTGLVIVVYRIELLFSIFFGK